MQALSSNKSARATGRSIGGMLRHRAQGGVTPVDAPLKIAKAIQFKIAKSGTRPHFFVRASMAEIFEALDRLITEAMPDR